MASGSESGNASASATVDSIVRENKDVNMDHMMKRTKKLTSDVWEHFERIVVRSEEGGKSGTSHLRNHYNSRHAKAAKGQQVLALSKIGEDVVLDTYRYDEQISVRKYNLAIIMHEYPFNYAEHEYTNDFIKSLRPEFPIRSRTICRKEVIDIYNEEKKKLYDFFSSLPSRVSCTMDMWTSGQNKGYLCVTAHFIDDNWDIQKRIINFMHLEGRHTGANMSNAFVRNMVDWNIDRKLFCLTLDNASSNEICVRDIVYTLDEQDALVCNGKFFHVRCANHIINLIAKDGLKQIGKTVDNIRASVLIVKSSSLQKEEFQKKALECGLDIKKGLSMDVATRWNSTYLMLRDALYYKKAFQRLALADPEKYYKCAPSKEEWEKARILCSCLSSFHIITELLSGTSYPTANLFFQEFCEVKLTLTNWVHNTDPMIARMARFMIEKFDKYWDLTNIIFAIANFLDPRYKMKMVEFYFDKIYLNNGVAELGIFKVVLKELFDEYASTSPILGHDVQSCVGSSSSMFAIHDDVDFDDTFGRKRKLEEYLQSSSYSQLLKTELDQYKEAAVVPRTRNFDILSWWKTEGAKYPILARIARDVLVIPVSTVASESAFSAGGRVIDPYRSRLDPVAVEALVCAKDWISASRKGPTTDIPSLIREFQFDAVEEVQESSYHMEA